MSQFPSGSVKKAMWHTPVSCVSPLNCTPAPSSAARASTTLGTRNAIPAGFGANLSPSASRLPEAKRHVAGVELVRAVLGEAQRHAVKILRSVKVLRWNGDEVDALDFDQPTEPSIWSWIRRFISTAYSSGSSLVIGSTKPETIIAEASVSVSPRDMR